MHRNVVCGCLLGLLLLVACGGPQERQSAETTVQTGENTVDLLASAPAKRLLTYWDDVDFTEVQAAGSDALEQQFVDFIALFPTVPDTAMRVAVHGMLKKASAKPETLTYFLEQYEHYLYDPNSPMSNEAYYEPVLTYLLADEGVTEEEKMKFQTQLEMGRLNKVGTEATDFEYLGVDGSYHRLHEGSKPYKMLVFYDPTCTHCAEVIQSLAQTAAVNNCIKNNFLEVVAVSLLPDRDSWTDYQAHIPENWINGWDEKGAVIQEALYNVRAYPTIFLLNQANVVLLKDAPPEATLRYLVKEVSRT